MAREIKCIYIAKGIAIIAVILGHLGLGFIDKFVFTFHMPLFFILSGFFFNPAKSIRKRIGALIKPYIFTAICLILIELVFALHRYHLFLDLQVFQRVFEWLLATFYGAGTSHTLGGIYEIPYIGAIWFLLALGWAQTALWALAKTSATKTMILFISVVFLAFGMVTSKYIWLPLSIQPGMTAIIFVSVGYMLKEIDVWSNRLIVVVSCGVWCISIVYAYVTGDIFMMASCQWHNVPLDIIGGVGSTITILAFSQWLEYNVNGMTEILVTFGKSSLIVLCFHLIELNQIDGKVNMLCVNMGLSLPAIYGVRVIYKLAWAWFWIQVYNRSPKFRALLTCKK